jgi:AhpD family alkylhydroperoxidase
MPQFERHTPASAPAGSQELLRRLQEQVGFVPNLAAVMAESPVLLEAFLTLRATAARGALDPVSREIVAIAVGREIPSTYCVAAHSTFALKQGADPEAVAAVRAGNDPSDPRQAALARFASAVVRHDPSIGERTRELIAAGFTPTAVLDALVPVAVTLLAGAARHVTGAAVDAAFQPQSWEPAAAAAAR